MRKNKQDGVGNQANSDIKSHFMGSIKVMALKLLMSGMGEVVEEICGSSYERGNDRVGRRAGSEKATVELFGERHLISRPRMRRREGLGVDQEIENPLYESVKRKGLDHEELFGYLRGGMSYRSLGKMGKVGGSPHYARKAWLEKTADAIEAIQDRDLRQYEFIALMCDAVVLAKELVMVVALGVTVEGEKVILGFVRGSSENYETCRELMEKIIARGFRPVAQKLLAILDGSEALEKAVRVVFQEVEVQRCLVHKERNLHSYLSYRDRGECSRLMREIRLAQGSLAGNQAYQRLEKFLAAKNDGALKSLHEAGETILTLQRLECSQLLHSSFQSTNHIENVFMNFRRLTGKVCYWRVKTDQPERWTATALLNSESGFRKIRGWEKLPDLLEKLGGRHSAAASDCVTGEANPSGSSTPFTSSDASQSSKSNRLINKVLKLEKKKFRKVFVS